MNPTTNNHTAAVFVIGEGTVTALAGGPLSLADLGPRQTKRVSKIEFNDLTQRWQVSEPNDTAWPDRVLAEFDDYDAALAWERDYFNQLLKTSPENSALKTTDTHIEST